MNFWRAFERTCAGFPRKTSQTRSLRLGLSHRHGRASRHGAAPRGPPHAEGIRFACISCPEAGQSRESSHAAGCDLGRPEHRAGGISAGFCRAAAEETRTRGSLSALYHHRAVGRLSVRAGRIKVVSGIRREIAKNPPRVGDPAPTLLSTIPARLNNSRNQHHLAKLEISEALHRLGTESPKLCSYHLMIFGTW